MSDCPLCDAGYPKRILLKDQLTGKTISMSETTYRKIEEALMATNLMEKIDIALRDVDPSLPTVTVPLGKDTADSVAEELTKAGYGYFITEDPPTIVISVNPPMRPPEPPKPT